MKFNTYFISQEIWCWSSLYSFYLIDKWHLGLNILKFRKSKLYERRHCILANTTPTILSGRGIEYEYANLVDSGDAIAIFITSGSFNENGRRVRVEGKWRKIQEMNASVFGKFRMTHKNFNVSSFFVLHHHEKYCLGEEVFVVEELASFCPSPKWNEDARQHQQK